jgi:hypothetical protein
MKGQQEMTLRKVCLSEMTGTQEALRGGSHF